MKQSHKRMQPGKVPAARVIGGWDKSLFRVVNRRWLIELE